MLITVDTGATKTLVASFDSSGKVHKEHRFLTPKNKVDYIDQLKKIIKEDYDHTSIDGMVIAVPGIVRDNLLVWWANLKWQGFGFDIVKALQPTVSCPIWLENDANLAGLAEAKILSPLPQLSLYITVSTGIGTGVIIDGQITPALSAIEGGQMLIEYDGAIRTWEKFASGSAIKRTYNRLAKDIKDQVIWQEIADKISRGLLVLIPMLHPDVIIIGGSVGSYFPSYESLLQKILNNQLNPHFRKPQIKQASHPEKAVLYGCYYYGVDQLSS